jgi:hypothetical protein
VQGREVTRELPPGPNDPNLVGAIEIWAGGPSGPARPIVITQNHRGVPGTDRADTVGDSFGHTLVVGDFDRDRFADIAVGAPTRRSRRWLGRLVVIHGGRSGYTPGGEIYSGRRLGVPNAERRLAVISLTLLDRNGDRRPELTFYAAGEKDRGVLVTVPASSRGLAVRRNRVTTLPRTVDGEFPDFGPFPFLNIRLLSLGRAGSSA